MNNKQIGNKIKVIRQQLGYTQKEFGELVDGANSSLVSKWERGTTTPNIKRQKLIADLSGLEVNTLFNDESDYDAYSESYDSHKNIDIEHYLNLLEDYFTDIVEEQSSRLGEPFASKFRRIELNSLKEKLIEAIENLPPILHIDGENNSFIGTINEYKEETGEDYIEMLIQDIIRDELYQIRTQTPNNDAKVLYNVKQEIIRVEEMIRSYYMDDFNKKYDNDDLSLEMYENISKVLKDTIFNLVRLEEYI